MQDKQAPGPLTPMEFAEMMQELSAAGEWMPKQLRLRSGQKTGKSDDHQDGRMIGPWISFGGAQPASSQPPRLPISVAWA